MATPTNKQPPIRRLNTRVDPWNGALPASRSSGSVARDLYPHLRSSAAERPEVTPKPKPPERR
jgi:hypothetical protein